MRTSGDEFVKTGLAYASENLLLDQEPLNYTGITSSLRWLHDAPGDEIDWASLAAQMPVNILFGEKDSYCPVEHSGLLDVPDLYLTLIPDWGTCYHSRSQQSAKLLSGHQFAVYYTYDQILAKNHAKGCSPCSHPQARALP